MEWLERTPLPVECQGCNEADCYNCDHAGRRWYLSDADELRLRRTGLLRAIARLEKQVAEIDRQLAELDDPPNVLMSREMWETCLQVCLDDQNFKQFIKLWSEYPEFADGAGRE